MRNIIPPFIDAPEAPSQDLDIVLPDSRIEMPELFIPGRKPTGQVVIDWSHPLARGLELGAIDGTEIVKNRPTNFATPVVPVGGEMTQISGASPGYNSSSFKLINDVLFGTGDASLYFRVYVRDASFYSGNTTHSGGWVEQFGGAFGARVSLAYYGPTTVALYCSRRFSATGPSDLGVNQPNKIYSYVWTISGGGTHSLYRSDKAAPIVDAGSYGTYSNDDMTAGGSYPDYYYRLNDDDSEMNSFFVWRRTLSQSESRIILKDPYQFLIPA